MKSRVVRALISIIAVSFMLQSCQCQRDGNQSTLSEAEKQGKKIFHMPRYNAYRSLDPVKQWDSASQDIIQSVYDRLLEYHYLKRPYELTPGLLEKMPELQDDQRTLVFELRKGVYFHDDECFEKGQGRELVSDDVIYNIKRFADANANSLSYALMKGYVVGMDAFRERSRKQGKSFDYAKNEIEGLKRLSKYTFSVKLTRDNPVAIFPFAMSQFSIYPREAVEKYGDDFAHHPVGTGPFYAHKMDRRGEIVLRKNTRYFGTYPTEGAEGDKEAGLLADAGRKIPFVDEIRWPLIEEAQPVILSFQKAKIDFARIDRESFTKFLVRGENGLELKPDIKSKWNMFAEPGLNMDYFRFNMNDKVVGGMSPEKKALRQAIGYALNIPGFLTLIYNDRGIPLKTLLPVPIKGSEKYINPKHFSYDTAKAKELLAKAGYPEGKGLPEIVFEYRSAAPQIRQQWEYLRANLAEAGIKAKANFQTFSSFLKKTDSGNFQVSAGGWVADYPDPENFYALLYGPNQSPGPNHGFYKSSRYDELFKKMRFMRNGDERNKIITELANINFEDGAMIPLYSIRRVGMFHKWVKNVKRNVLYHPPLKFIDVDLKKKAEGIK